MKLKTAAALSASGYFCAINVTLSATTGAGLADVTDVDVLAVRHDVTFAQHHIAASCKSGNAPIAREVFYLRGVLDYLTADEGVALFSFADIDPHLRDLGRHLSVRVLDGGEGDRWRRAITNGLPYPGYYDPARHAIILKAFDSLGPAHPVREWLKTDYWYYRDFRNLPRGVNRLRAAAAVFTGKADWHSIVFFDVAAHLCLTILDLCRTICALGLSGIKETTAAYLFGGTTSYRARKELHTRVLQMLGETGLLVKGGPMLPPLEPAYAPALAELALRFIERPHAAAKVPLVLQDAMWRTAGAGGLSFDDDFNSLAAQKLAQDVIEFLRSAAGGSWTPTVLRLATNNVATPAAVPDAAPVSSKDIDDSSTK